MYTELAVSKYWYRCVEYTGKDADEMYEDIGHSNEARKTMKKYLIGNLEVKMVFCHRKTVVTIWTKSEQEIDDAEEWRLVHSFSIVALIACLFWLEQLTLCHYHHHNHHHYPFYDNNY